MNQENVKLERIKKSCKVAGIVTRIAFMICVIGSVIMLISGIVTISTRKNVEQSIVQALEENEEVAIGKKVGNVNVYFAKFNPGSMKMLKYMRFESSIPAWQDILDETPYAFAIGLMLVSMSFGVAILAFALFQIYSVFDIIKKEDTPFSEKVLKKLLIALIIIDVIIALTSGLGQAAIGGLITWAVYSIMDYGRVLQIQSDETL